MNNGNVVWFFADGFSEFNSSYFTCVVPHNALQSAGYNSKILHVHEFMDNTDSARGAIAGADTVIVQRVLINDAIPSARFWMERGKRVLVSFDDAYHLIGEENAAYKFWGKGEVEIVTGTDKRTKKLSVHPVEQFRRNLRLISGGVTPSRVLARDWKPYAPMVYLPNFLECSRYQILRPLRDPRQRLNIGWGGSLSHLTSFSHSGVEGALRRVLDEDHTVFAVVGDKRIVKQLDLPKESVWYREYVMFFDWPKVVKTFDIGLAPLAMPYDQRRSRLKVMEYIASGVPFVATKSEAYEDFFDVKSGIFVDQGSLDVCDKTNESGWYKAMKTIVANYDDFRKLAIDAAMEWRPKVDTYKQVESIAAALFG